MLASGAVSLCTNEPSPTRSSTPAERASLAAEVDTIVHNGASVNLLAPYRVLRATNVESTRELLRLACSGRRKAFHYISSIAVLSARELRDRPRIEELPPADDP